MTVVGKDVPGDDRCFRCRGEVVVVGLAPQGASRPPLLPRHCGFPSYVLGVIPSQPLRICLSCGLVWSAVDPAALRALIFRHGQELARQHLDEIDHGRYRDLPDSEAAREIADWIAELDAAARSDNPGAVVRRYRELRGVTWDQAHHDVRDWPRFTREAKLKLFGWEPKKKKGAVDDFDSPFY